MSENDVIVSYKRIKYYIGKVKPNLASPIVPVDAPDSEVADEHSPITWTLVGEQLFALRERLGHLELDEKEKKTWALGGGTAILSKHAFSGSYEPYLVKRNAGDWIAFRSELGIKDGKTATDRWQIYKFKPFPDTEGTNSNQCDGR
mgnify:CR=1 FL=1